MVSPAGCVLLASALFGSAGLAVRLAEDASAASIGLGRIVVGGLVLAFLARARLAGELRAHWRSPGRRGVLAASVCAMIAYQPLFFFGVQRNGAAMATVLALGSAPVFAGALQVVSARWRPSGSWVLWTGGAVTGLALSTGVVTDLGQLDAAATMASLAAGAAFAGYATGGAHLIRHGGTAATTMTLLVVGAAGMAAPWWLTTDLNWVLTPGGAAGLLWVGIVTTAAGNLLLGRSLAGMAPARVATLTLAEPLTAVALGVVVLGERLGPGEILGCVVLMCCLVGQATGQESRERRPIDWRPVEAPTPAPSRSSSRPRRARAAALD
ncbi:DMT family transporter [Nocardioides sp. SYSU D00065]|uniref:DMT family transporter n=1 Tax=Nocardioides sp. SYSU D00065 TaxID=2817378 RepID=UPI001FEE4A9E|nr:DMT family transporter [Nocardioides sp. SYSU D00065]